MEKQEPKQVEFNTEKFREAIDDLMQSKPQSRPRQFIAGPKMLKALFGNKTKSEIKKTLERVTIITNSDGQKYIKQKLKGD